MQQQQQQQQQAQSTEIGNELQRTKRLQLELRSLVKSGEYDIDLGGDTGDALDIWNIKLYKKNLPQDSGLAADLDELIKRNGQDHIHLQVNFPAQYPTEPPFFRVVSPRFKWHTGHVSVGGSVCLEVLVNTHTAAGYKSRYVMESLLWMVIINLVSDNPAAGVGPGRIDFDAMFGPQPRTGYSEDDARKHFNRIIGQHGWINWSADGRKPCSFAPNCYRKNPQHWAEFSHEGQEAPVERDDAPPYQAPSPPVSTLSPHAQPFVPARSPSSSATPVDGADPARSPLRQ
ncbi:ubiquitin-conjugating enzyme family protein [Capsaspora owczarzaki ATCC 30864]|uniref:Ubiquitin-conjugating enzyme family protein n=1 Tax=Capsaspora owczarzaki (strain ATCC 30864) TaxID=595528 RepID=A0A0D2WGH7_CAPO3|nr:ubiquitin-conjugating enzyme family protein [Capsaspora owczarzaki ATCC 30864]KJE88515.1 ubiquitin-conjugating enzyme family protein [Capsaspora owczarzaki ATCC 30864]|eukprot:XP_004365034.1 ubiquitin-conjugating enzyme family protein [Capsaspora owczarzaki ATCC 30864]